MSKSSVKDRFTAKTLQNDPKSHVVFGNAIAVSCQNHNSSVERGQFNGQTVIGLRTSARLCFRATSPKLKYVLKSAFLGHNLSLIESKSW